MITLPSDCGADGVHGATSAGGRREGGIQRPTENGEIDEIPGVKVGLAPFCYPWQLPRLDLQTTVNRWPGAGS